MTSLFHFKTTAGHRHNYPQVVCPNHAVIGGNRHFKTSKSTVNPSVLRLNKYGTPAIDPPKERLEWVVDTKSPSTGKFGRFGGRFVAETLISALEELEVVFHHVLQDPEFQEELTTALKDYVGRETPLYYAERLTAHYKGQNLGRGPDIYIKREDLAHLGAHKMNNALAQAMIAKRMGLTAVIAATGAGQHGVATAAACAKFGLSCTIFMGTADMEKQPSSVDLMNLLGAKVRPTAGSFKDATSDSIRDWTEKLGEVYYLAGTAVGPHPCPTMVREFQSVIGRETRRQAAEKWGGTPDAVVACVGSGSNALGIFHEFVRDPTVRLIVVEAAGFGLNSGKHAATLAAGEVGVYHGAMSYLLQDEEGQIICPHSVGVGMEYPGVAPELSFLKETGRMEFYSASDEEAVEAYRRVARLEGILPALEASHAFAYLEKLCPTLPDGAKIIISCSGRGEKDTETVFNYPIS
ncbi:unnamed protein product [Linum trigynum]|uniref:Tryptophan synthase n=1 Tax=Linum trigynum TaxID=586398 RepID=A0AAV2FJX0_9ROSI